MLLTASDDGTARLWPVLRVTEPVPDWLIDLAEALGGQHLNDQEQFEPVASSRLVEIAQKCKSSSGTDYFSRWGKWFFGDRAIADPGHFPP